MKYEVVPHGMRSRLPRSLKAVADDPIIKELLAGKTVQIPETEFKASTLRKAVLSLGKRLRTRTHDGCKIVWIEDGPHEIPIEAEPVAEESI